MLLTIGGLAMVFACLALIGLVGTAARDTAARALAEADNEDQRVTAVCIGLNIGSCRTTQTSTSTRPADGASEGNPWPVILLAVALICPLVVLLARCWLLAVGAVVTALDRLDGAR